MIDVSFTKHLTKDARRFSGTIHLQNRKVVLDSVRTLTWKTWKEVVREDCQARKLNKEDAMDRCKWRKMIKEAR